MSTERDTGTAGLTGAGRPGGGPGAEENVGANDTLAMPDTMDAAGRDGRAGSSGMSDSAVLGGDATGIAGSSRLAGTSGVAATSGTAETSGDGGDAAVDSLLFDPHDARAFHARWQDVQSRFVDDPRGAVQEADALVAEVTRKLIDGFAAHRAALESQWPGDSSTGQTEDLRLALRRYRTFFHRLLAA